MIFSVSVEIAACTHSALREKSRTRAHTPKQVAFWVGALSLPSTRAARSRTSPGRVSERQTLPLFSLGREVLSKNAESLRNSDVLMRVAVPRRRGPAGLRDLFRFCRNCGLYTLRSGPFRVCEARGGITTLSALYVLLKRWTAACQSGYHVIIGGRPLSRLAKKEVDIRTGICLLSDLLAASSILCCLRTASPQGIAALAAQGGVATLAERSDETFTVGQFSSADRE